MTTDLRNHNLVIDDGMTVGGWHALRYSEGRGCCTPFGVPQGVPPQQAATTPFAALRACHPGCANCTGYGCALPAGPPERPRVLIACVGNIFLGDDAFGVEVAQRLARRPLPEGVRVVDFGIRGLDLAYALLEGYEAVVLVDAASRGGRPGTLYVLEPEQGPALPPAEAVPLLDTHNMDPARVLRLVAALGGQVQRLVLVGCEPETAVGGEDVPAEMSAAVRAAVDEAVLLVEGLVARLLGAGGEGGAAGAVVCPEKAIPGKEVRTCHRWDQKA